MNIHFRNWQGDIFGGITAGIVALPLALAFGVYSGLGAAAGLYSAIALGFFAALLGGTPTQVSGPTGPMTVISALVITQAIQHMGTLNAALGLILATFLLAGFFQIVLGAIRIGDYIRYIPYPVVSGFMSGVGVIIVLLQVYPLLGASSPKNTIEVIKQFPHLLTHIDWPSAAMAGGTIGIIYLLPRITRVVPSALVALLVMTGVSVLWSHPSISTIGHIPEGFPEFKLQAILHSPIIIHLDWVLVPALTLAALGVIDSLLTSVVADNLTKTRHLSNKELVGQGAGNMIAALFGGIPGAGATMRTVVNIKSGATTRLSGMIHSVLLLIILLGAGPYAAQIPHPVLAGILVTVGIGIIDYRSIKHIRLIPLSDAGVMTIVFVMTVFVDLIQAVAIGMILASVLFMKKMAEINQERSSGNTLHHSQLHTILNNLNAPEESVLSELLAQKVYIKDLYGPLFFGFTSHFQTMSLAIPEVKVVVIRMHDVPYIDQSGLYALEDALLYLASKGITLTIVGLQPQPDDMMRRIDIIPGLITDDHLFSSMNDCMRWLKAFL